MQRLEQNVSRCYRRRRAGSKPRRVHGQQHTPRSPHWVEGHNSHWTIR
jgi:hypothetical protein